MKRGVSDAKYPFNKMKAEVFHLFFVLYNRYGASKSIPDFLQFIFFSLNYEKNILKVLKRLNFEDFYNVPP